MIRTFSHESATVQRLTRRDCLVVRSSQVRRPGLSARRRSLARPLPCRPHPRSPDWPHRTAVSARNSNASLTTRCG